MQLDVQRNTEKEEISLLGMTRTSRLASQEKTPDLGTEDRSVLTTFFIYWVLMLWHLGLCRRGGMATSMLANS